MGGKVPTYHFCFHYETHEIWNHSNVRSLTVKMGMQSTVILRTEQHLVKEMIWPSRTSQVTTTAMVIVIEAIVVVTLAPHTSHHMAINMTPNKPSRCLLVDATSHQQPLKYFTE